MPPVRAGSAQGPLEALGSEHALQTEDAFSQARRAFRPLSSWAGRDPPCSRARAASQRDLSWWRARRGGAPRWGGRRRSRAVAGRGWGGVRAARHGVPSPFVRGQFLRFLLRAAFLVPLGVGGGTRPDLLCSSPSPVGGPCAPRLRPSGSGPGRSLPARGCFLRGGGGSGRPARPPRPSGEDRGPSAGLVLGERFQELPGWHLVGPLWPLLPQLPGQRPPTPLRGSLRPHLGLARFSALGGQGDGVWLAQGLGPGQGGEHGRPRRPLQATCPVSSCEALHVWFGPV